LNGITKAEYGAAIFVGRRRRRRTKIAREKSADSSIQNSSELLVFGVSGRL